jgi:hypothetical protein
LWSEATDPRQIQADPALKNKKCVIEKNHSAMLGAHFPKKMNDHAPPIVA